MRLKDAPFLASTVLACAVVSLAGRINATPELYWIFQPLITGLIAWVAWRRGMLANHYAQFITLGLLLSLLADTLRLSDQQTTAGAGLLVTACLSYLWALTAESALRLWAWPMILALVGGALFGWTVFAHLDSVSRLPAVISILIVFLMLGQAASRLQAVQAAMKIHALIALGGTTLISTSLIILLVESYIRQQPEIAIWSYIPYWAGQTLLALSVPEREHDTNAVD